jgi:hypothetical protein
MNTADDKMSRRRDQLGKIAEADDGRVARFRADGVLYTRANKKDGP